MNGTFEFTALTKLKHSTPTMLEREIGEWLIFNRGHLKMKCQSMLTLLTLVMEEPVSYLTFKEFCDKGLLKIIKEEVEMNFLLNGEEILEIMDIHWIEWILGESLMNLAIKE